jgi:hypothetical protein
MAKRTQRTERGMRRLGQSFPERDWRGTVLVLLGLGGLAYGLMAAPTSGWNNPIVFASLTGRQTGNEYEFARPLDRDHAREKRVPEEFRRIDPGSTNAMQAIATVDGIGPQSDRPSHDNLIGKPLIAVSEPKIFGLPVCPATWCYKSYQTYQTYQT